MKFGLPCALTVWLFVGGILPAEISNPQPTAAPPLTQSLKIEQDQVGKSLQAAFVWADVPVEKEGVAVGFRKIFDLTAQPTVAYLHLFADARYILWVNGAYVDRGPARFQPNGPEYDSLDITRFLKSGKNAVALLVVGNLSGGKVMRHRPGLTASLEVDGTTLWKTDRTWRWSDRTKYRTVTATWANLGETQVDARVEDGDWTKVDYDDRGWKSSAKIDSSSWGALTARRIPMLRESEVPYRLLSNAILPLTLHAGEKLEFTTDRIVQAYPIITIDASAGTEITLDPFGLHYVAKEGEQSHFPIDTRGMSQGSISVKSGQATITGLKLIERLYPYERLGAFHSSDEYLNKLWNV